MPSADRSIFWVMEDSIFWTALIGFAMIQSLAFSVLFLTKRTAARQAKWILSSLSLCCFLILIEKFLHISGEIQRFPHIIFASSPCWYLLGPLLFLYLRLQIKRSAVKPMDMLHFLPFLLVILHTLNFYRFSAGDKLKYLQIFEAGEWVAPEHHINFIIFFFQAIIYTIFSFRLLKLLDQNESKFKWYTALLCGLACISLFGIFQIFSAQVGNQTLIEISCFLFAIWLTSFTFCFFIQAVHNPNQIFFPSMSRMTTSHSLSSIIHSVSQHMDQYTPYLDPNYSLPQLAQSLNISQHQLTQAFRTHRHQNFRNFLNHYRLQRAKMLLASPASRQYTIDSISHEAGFASVATFYRLFKKHVGSTPSEYIESASK